MESELYTKINTWFYKTWRDNVSPATTVICVYNEFLDSLEKCGLFLEMHENIFIRKLCSATCNYYQAYLTGAEPGGPTKFPAKPRGWDADIEHLWMDYLYSQHFTEQFWNQFWKNLQTADWECDHLRWRSYIQSILPLYVKRDIDLLKDAGVIYEDDEGNFVSAEDYIPYADEEEY